MPEPTDPPSDPAHSIAYEPPEEGRPATSAPTELELEQETPSVAPLDYSPAPAAHDPYAALRHPAYRRFSIGWMAAVIGGQATATALGWEIFDRTGDLSALGWLAGVQVIPLVLLALPAGVIADRFDRRRIIQATAFVGALCSIGLALLSYRAGSVPWMFGLVIAGATVQTIGRPARWALLPNTVPKAVFSNAITWNSSFFQVSTMAGAALGGLLIWLSKKWLGNLSLPYLLEAATGLFYAVILFTLPAHLGRARERATGGPAVSALGQLSAGIRFVHSTKIILATLTLDLFAVLLGGAVYLLPVFAKDILNVDSVHFGWLRAGEAIGALAMAMLIAHLPPMKHAGRTMLLAVAGFGLATLVFGLSRNYYLSLAMVVLIGAFDNVSVVVRHTLVQVLTPDAMRGRVSAVNNIFIGASNELGGLESSLTAKAFLALALTLGYSDHQAAILGPTWSVVAGGIGTLGVVMLTAIIFPQLRKYGALQPPADAIR